MNPELIKDKQFSIKKLSYSNDYYSNVFKKTEKLVSATFYIVSFIERTPHSLVHIESMSGKSMRLYETALASLALSEFEAPERLFVLQQELVALEGAFRIAEGARVLTPELLTVLLEPVDLVIRYLRNHYFQNNLVGISSVMSENAERAARPVAAPRPPRLTTSNRVMIPKGDISSDAHLVYSQLTDRGERIKTVLDAKPAATIKDIAEVITDVSEKTIQRELNSLIEKGQVIRQGERRWSKYSIAK